MSGRGFESSADFNIQFGEWLMIAHRRVVRTIKTRPVNLLEGRSSRDAPVATSAAGGRLGQSGPTATRLLRPHRQQRLLGRPSVIGRFVDVTAVLDR